jgi:hypothetical protein
VRSIQLVGPMTDGGAVLALRTPRRRKRPQGRREGLCVRRNLCCRAMCMLLQVRTGASSERHAVVDSSCLFLVNNNTQNDHHHQQAVPGDLGPNAAAAQIRLPSLSPRRWSSLDVLCSRLLVSLGCVWLLPTSVHACVSDFAVIGSPVKRTNSRSQST